jgi:hypothetical protein
LLLIRIAATTVGLTWAKIAGELDLLTPARSPARQWGPADRRTHYDPARPAR